MATTSEKLQDTKLASEILNRFEKDIKSGKFLLLITQENGRGETDYLRVSIVTTKENGELEKGCLTWAISRTFGYFLRDRGGYWNLAIGGGGYSKADDVAYSLAHFYGVDRIRYELN
jgi:hypothetical protein